MRAASRHSSGCFRETDVERAAAEFDFFRSVAEFYLDGPAQAREQPQSGRKANRQMTLGIAADEMQPQPIGFAIVEGNAVVLVKKKLAVCAGINGNGQRALDFFVDVLLD